MGEGRIVCSGRCIGAQKHKFRFLSIYLKNFLKSLTIFCEWLIMHVGDIMMHVGDTLSTVGCSLPCGYNEYRGGYLEHRGGYHDARGGIS